MSPFTLLLIALLFTGSQGARVFDDDLVGSGHGRKLQDLLAFSPSTTPPTDPENVVVVPPPDAVQESPAFDPASIEIVPVGLPMVAPAPAPVSAPLPAAVVPASLAPAIVGVEAPTPAAVQGPTIAPATASPQPAASPAPVLSDPFATPPLTLPDTDPDQSVPREAAPDVTAPPSSSANVATSTSLAVVAICAVLLAL